MRQGLDIEKVPKYVVESYYNSWELGMIESFSPVGFNVKYHEQVRKKWTDYVESLGLKDYQVHLQVKKKGQLQHLSYNELARYCQNNLGLKRFQPDYSQAVKG